LPSTATSWLSPDDGFLVLDRNLNGLIDSGRELFGDSTIKRDGQRAADGFDALRDLDSNADGKISALDSRFAELRLWRDLNQDGVSQSNELSTLGQLNVASINVAASAHSQTLANGNQIADLGTYTRGDGSVGTTGEVTGNLADINLVGDPSLALTRIDPFLLTRPDPLPGVARWHVKERKASRHRGTLLDW